MPQVCDKRGMQKGRKAKKQGFISVGGLSPKLIEAIKTEAEKNQRSVAGEVRALLIRALAQHAEAAQ